MSLFFFLDTSFILATKVFCNLDVDVSKMMLRLRGHRVLAENY